MKQHLHQIKIIFALAALALIAPMNTGCSESVDTEEPTDEAAQKAQEEGDLKKGGDEEPVDPSNEAK